MCQDSSVFLTRELPLSITRVFSKSIVWPSSQAWLAILEPFLKTLVFRMCSFFLVCKHLPVSPKKGFCRQHSFADLMKVLIWGTQIPVAGS